MHYEYCEYLRFPEINNELQFDCKLLIVTKNCGHNELTLKIVNDK